MTTTRKLYRLNDGNFVRTLAEIPKDQETNRVDVPVDSPELCQFLNQLLSERPDRKRCSEPTLRA